jgi:hypothetical protein
MGIPRMESMQGIKELSSAFTDEAVWCDPVEN